MTRVTHGSLFHSPVQTLVQSFLQHNMGMIDQPLHGLPNVGSITTVSHIHTIHTYRSDPSHLLHHNPDYLHILISNRIIHKWNDNPYDLIVDDKSFCGFIHSTPFHSSYFSVIQSIATSRSRSSSSIGRVLLPPSPISLGPETRLA